jgi:hypothetical protein
MNMTEEHASQGPEPYLAVEIPRHGQLRFKNFEEVQRWMLDERAQWAWLINGGPASGESETLRQAYINGFSRIENAVNSLRTNVDNITAKNGLANELTNFYRNGVGYLSSDPSAIFGQEIATQLGRDAAAAAFATLIGRTFGITNNTSAAIVGIVKATLHSDNISAESPGVTNEALRQIMDGHQKQVEEQGQSWDGFVRSAEQTIANWFESGNNKLAAFDERLVSFNEETRTRNENFSHHANETIASIQKTEKAYKEQMALQAPVEYWSAEEREHRREEKRFAWVGGVYAACVFVSIVGALFIGIPALARDVALKDNPYPYLAAASGALLLVTIFFWVGRILGRLFLSARHLAIDAGERVALIQTYLALTQDGKIAEAERTLVLTPLFRSSSDGIVKDEGGTPDLSLASFLAKLADNKK